MCSNRDKTAWRNALSNRTNWHNLHKVIIFGPSRFQTIQIEFVCVVSLSLDDDVTVFCPRLSLT